MSWLKWLLGRLNAFITELEDRARIASPVAFGGATKRVFFPGGSLSAADPERVGVNPSTATRLSHAPWAAAFDVYGPDGKRLVGSVPSTSCCA